MTSVLRLHDATKAYLSMKHEAAKQAANEMALKDIDKFYFDRRISSSSGDGGRRGGQHRRPGKVRHVARRLLCAAHLREGNVLSFSARTGDSEMKGRLRALRVEKMSHHGAGHITWNNKVCG